LISRSTVIEYANVPTKRPTASWLRRSCRIVRTIRGENWPIASCTATSVSESSTLVSVTSEVEAVLRIVCTEAPEPVTDVPTMS
jgi:hypothetical protein